MTQQIISFKCPLCESDQYSFIKKFNNGVTVGKCNFCKLFYTPLRDPKPENLFGSSDFNSLKLLYQPIIQGKVNHFRHQNFKKYLKLIARYTAEKKMLDIGCAHGFFPFHAVSEGYNVTAVEPDEHMARFAKEELNIFVKTGILNNVDLGPGKWNIVTFTDSLEYFIDPLQTLKKINENYLSENGIVFIKVPNGNYFYFRHWLKKTLGVKIGLTDTFTPSKRVAHYTAQTLKKLALSSGFNVLKLGHFAPIDSPPWYKHTGMWLEFEPPLCLVWKQRLTRRFLHLIGELEFLFFRKNHFSQSVFIVAKRLKLNN